MTRSVGELQENKTQIQSGQGLLRDFWMFLKSAGRSGKLAMLVAGLGLLSGIATYLAVSGITPLGSRPELVEPLLVLSLAFLVLLVVIITERLYRLWRQVKRGQAGSRLHIRLVAIFTAVAIAPAIIVAFFSLVTLNLGLSAWFSERIGSVVKNSVTVAEGYVEEHKKGVESDLLSMARLINKNAQLYYSDQLRFEDFFDKLTQIRGLPEAYIIDGSRQVITKAGLSVLAVYVPPTEDAVFQARSGEISIQTRDEGLVRALMRLEAFPDAFLYVSRELDIRILQQVNAAREGKLEYETMESQRSGIEQIFAFIFLSIVLLVLLAAIALGLWLANMLSDPVTDLMEASEKVATGNLSARVMEPKGQDEISKLSRTFNYMTEQLQTQQNQLMENNRQMDRRRRFMEAVLSGVSAGVIGLDLDGRVNLINQSAVDLLELRDDVIGMKIGDLAHEFDPLIEQATDNPALGARGQIRLVLQGHKKTFVVRIAVELSKEEARGYVVTFDDVTQLLSAQRTAAWADVARRIAHEIKNPLTPIQLAAERLKRKFSPQITEDAETYSRYVDTIVRQVGDIGKMVDEFSSFSRMPAPVFRSENLSALIKDAVFLQETGSPHIQFEMDLDTDMVPLRCDGRQIAQVLTNLLKNAVESIEGCEETKDTGLINVRMYQRPGVITLDITDNGKGLPKEDRHLLTEPYVTTRSKGTGLGLAIVRKVMEDHGGAIQLLDAPATSQNTNGALIRLTFRVSQDILPEKTQLVDETKAQIAPHEKKMGSAHVG